MKKVIDLGKIAYYNKNRKANRVTVEVELREKENGVKELSICGNIWNSRDTDCYSCGQNLDEIKKYIRTPMFKKLYRWWKEYHLNTHHAACEHQRALGWEEAAGKTVDKYRWTLNADVRRERREIEARILKDAKRGVLYALSEYERKLLDLKDDIVVYDDGSRPEHYEKSHYMPHETARVGWLREDEHPEGLLGKKCPKCGYRYGHGWNAVEIPEDTLKEITELLNAA